MSVFCVVCFAKPELVSLTKSFGQWQGVVCIDLHGTPGKFWQLQLGDFKLLTSVLNIDVSLIMYCLSSIGSNCSLEG
jgi:hypothetical protein